MVAPSSCVSRSPTLPSLVLESTVSPNQMVATHHCPRFKAVTGVNGISFTSPPNCNTSKDAQNTLLPSLPLNTSLVHHGGAGTTTTGLKAWCIQVQKVGDCCMLQDKQIKERIREYVQRFSDTDEEGEMQQVLAMEHQVVMTTKRGKNMAELDSTNVYRRLKEDGEEMYANRYLIEQCRGLIRGVQWDMEFRQIRRQANALADGLTNLALQQAEVFRELEALPLCIKISLY